MVTTITFMALSLGCPDIKMVLKKKDHAIMLSEVTSMVKHQEVCQERYKNNPCLSEVHIIDYGRAAVRCGPELIKEEE